MSHIINIENDFSPFNNFVEKLNPSKIFFLVDENTHEHCLPTVLGNFETEIPFEIIEIESGEDMKTLETASQLYEILTEFEADRKALLINLGGGVITDLGGFVASTYKRGIKFINFPTTLLAMCDASIGGKTGVNLGSIKNMVGTFCDAESVFIFPKFLETLPQQELLSGFAEMLKHGLICDRAHFEELSSLKIIDAENLTPYIYRSAEIKMQIVAQDPLEKNIRKNLNFGHTAGHALESFAMLKNSPVPHGYAVAYGMMAENIISKNLKLLSEDDCKTINEKIAEIFGTLDFVDFNDFDAIISLMKNDKKNDSGSAKMALLTEIGSCRYDIPVNETEISEAMKQFFKD